MPSRQDERDAKRVKRTTRTVPGTANKAVIEDAGVDVRYSTSVESRKWREKTARWYCTVLSTSAVAAFNLFSEATKEEAYVPYVLEPTEVQTVWKKKLIQ